jgi:hypothetical protein
MVQPWCVSRFYGQLRMLQASIENAGAILASARAPTGKSETAADHARHWGLADPDHIFLMRVLLGTVATMGVLALYLMLA